MKNNFLYNKFQEGFKLGTYTRVSDGTLSLFVGVDSEGHFSFDFRGAFQVKNLRYSGIIRAIHLSIPNSNELYLRFSLLNSAYLEYFCIFCQDLLDATVGIKDQYTAYKIICERYTNWSKLFRQRDLLKKQEIMGLIGELLFLKMHLLEHIDENIALNCWAGPEKLHKDFSLDDKWYEIKTTHNANLSVRISSIEQLDANDDGELVVYLVEEMSPEYDGINLNKLVTEISNKLSLEGDIIFKEKLSEIGYAFNLEYDKYVFDLMGEFHYSVTQDFPKLIRKHLPKAITKASYELNLIEIESFKL